MYVHLHRDISLYDEYGHVRYEKKNDHHVYHDSTTVAIPFGCLATTLEMLARPTRELGGVQTVWWVHIRAYEPCVE